MIVHHDGRHRREVLLREVGVDLVPAFLARLRVERHEEVVRRHEVEVVLPDAHAAVGDRRAALRAPEVVPELAAVARVERPRVVGRGHVERAVDHQRRALDVGRDGGQAFGTRTAHDDGRAAAEARAPRCAGPGRETRGPGEREVLDRRAIDLRERAEALAGVVAGVGRPVVAQRLDEAPGLERWRRGRRRGRCRGSGPLRGSRNG